MTETPKPVEVTQADREAAADIFAAAGWKGVAHRLRQGVVFPSDEPEEIAVNILARHRLSTRPEAQSLSTVSGDALFKAIQHGDDEHREWLKEAITAFYAGKPVPAPRGKGTALSPTVSEADGLVERTDSSLVADMLTAAAHQPHTRAFTNAQIVEAFAALEAAALRAQPSNDADGLADALSKRLSAITCKHGRSELAGFVIDNSRRILTALRAQPSNDAEGWRELLREARGKLRDVQGAYATGQYASGLIASIDAALANPASVQAGGEVERLRLALHRIMRTSEMSAGIMRDSRRTGGWEGAERTAAQFDRIAKDARAAINPEGSDHAG